MKMKSRKFLTLLLALALVLAMAAPAFAAWSSFQRNNVNNGRLIAAPLDANSTYSVTLPGESNASGVNTTPVINGSIAYTLYDGGAYSGNDGGARLSSVNMTTHSSNWNIQLDAAAGGSQQLSTPCLDTSGNGTLYAGMTHYTNELTSTGVTGWRYADNTPVSSFNFPSGATTIYYDGLVTPSDYYQPQLASNMIVPSGLNITGTLTLTDTSTSATYTLTGSGYEGYNFTLYNSSPSTLIPESTYDLELTITNDQALTGWTTLQYLVSNWKIYKVTDLTTTHSKSELTNGSGYGQINTHINKDSGNLYFGIYEGDRCFYQYNLSTSALTDFTPTGGEDFYWAGAAVCDKYDSVVFGSESGKVYMRPKGTDFGDLNEGDEITLPSAGNIRSSICYPGGYFYCTSKGGFVWQIATDLSSATAVDIKGGVYTASSSTPVKSDNDIVYVGSTALPGRTPAPSKACPPATTLTLSTCLTSTPATRCRAP